MIPAIDEDTLEHELTQQVVKEAVRAAMESPLRDPILEAVEEAGEATKTEETPSKSRSTSVLQGTTVFIVMLVVMYLALRRLTGENE